MKKEDIIIVNEKIKLNFFDELVFVAIKNGMHCSKGYVFLSEDNNFIIPKKPIHVSNLHGIILNHF